MKDDLGTRMKEQYENRTRYMLPRRTYTIIRLDGKAFHTFTRGMKRPYDEDLMEVMDETTKYLCENIQGCQMAYTQSDEISLLLTDFDKITTDAWFDGNLQKMASVSASITTAKFNNLMHRRHLVDMDKLAFFDARVFTIPDSIEVENYFIWRQKDAVRNSIAMTAQSLYSHKELNGKSSSEQQEMIFQKGQNWNDMPEGFKRGRTLDYGCIKEDWDAEPGNILEVGWKLITPDFLKDRETLRDMIPKIINE
ncbi:MAG TPA: tRNA(His) guanylyltransferase Thg1 family protein [Candidatus Paceibacterota bacterium]|nr:tRNA(His) guanylyltransferase Thg1 family protein [Candidatus Paceibacterota bacterium]